MRIALHRHIAWLVPRGGLLTLSYASETLDITIVPDPASPPQPQPQGV